MCKEKKIKKRTRAMGDRLETRDQYRVSDDRYEVLKSPACLQAQIMLLLLSLASPFTFNSHGLKLLSSCCPFHCFFAEKWRLWHCILDYLLYRTRKREDKNWEKESTLPCSPVLNTQNTDLNPNTLH